jgi:Holliday junction resolvase RusA-like endonuclease
MTEIIIPKLRVISKKNNPKLIRRGRITFRLPSDAFENFKSLAYEYLSPHQGSITKPFKMEVWYSIKGKYRQDIDNVCTSLLDVLQDYGVITNDNNCIDLHGIKSGGHKDFYTLIRLTELP